MKLICYPCRSWEFVNAERGDVEHDVECEECGTPMSPLHCTETRCRDPAEALTAIERALESADDIYDALVPIERVLKQDWEEAKDGLERQVQNG